MDKPKLVLVVITIRAPNRENQNLSVIVEHYGQCFQMNLKEEDEKRVDSLMKTDQFVNAMHPNWDNINNDIGSSSSNLKRNVQFQIERGEGKKNLKDNNSEEQREAKTNSMAQNFCIIYT